MLGSKTLDDTPRQADRAGSRNSENLYPVDSEAITRAAAAYSGGDLTPESSARIDLRLASACANRGATSSALR